MPKADVVSSPLVQAHFPLLDDLQSIVTENLARRSKEISLAEAIIHEKSEEFAHWLVDKGGVVTVPGTAFGKRGEGHLRLCYAVSMPQLQRAVEGFERAVDAL